MFNNNKDYYPTPEKIINKMISGVDFTYIQNILEPSAGSGNIVDVLMEKMKNRFSRYNQHNYSIDCIEKDESLCSVLRGKEYRVIYNDFLSFHTYKEYDLILMNPPFSEGGKHLLKAISMQEKHGGAIICLLNAETLKNPYSNERKMLQQKLEENNASIEYIKGAFDTSDTERKTDVEIALIKVDFPKVERKSFILENLRKTEAEEEIINDDCNYQVAENDLFKSIVAQYKMEIKAGIKLIHEYEAMRSFICSSYTKDETTGEIKKEGSILSLDLSSNKNRYRNELSVNNFIKEVRGKYWKTLFENPKFTGKLTENLRTEFYNKVEKLKEYDFSLYNIYQIKIDMNKQMIKGVEDTIISLFEELSNKYHYFDETSKNIHYYNGWKTNKSWIINKKVIIPLHAFDKLWSNRFGLDHESKRKLKDIEKCFNYLDGGLTEAIDIDEALSFAEEFGETKNIQLKYFTVSFYKKGTCHITFCNEELLKKFNIFGSQHKGWLPPSYGKKKYTEMTKEEKDVINEFDGGEKEYNKIINNKKYYLFNTSSIKMIKES